MSFKDIFKNSFINGFVSSQIDTKTIIICTLITAVIGMFIFMMYRIVTRKTFYNKTFNISIPAMAIITAAIILTIQSNIVLSLGMVGALSIVRFRTAVKDPLDLVFLYWSISVGIICGAGLAFIAVIVSIIMAIVVVLLQKYPDKKLSKILVKMNKILYKDVLFFILPCSSSNPCDTSSILLHATRLIIKQINNAIKKTFFIISPRCYIFAPQCCNCILS